MNVKSSRKYTVLFVGGCTLGPVMPLLAVAKILRRERPFWKEVWIGTHDGPESEFVEKHGLPFFALPVLKCPRYFSVIWITWPFRWIQVIRKSRQLLDKLCPSVILTAGGFTAWPIVSVARKRGISCMTHQLDLVPGLTNRHIARFCVSVTTSFEYARAPFGDRVSDQKIATPTLFQHKNLPERNHAAIRFGLNPHRPVVLVMGGGTGSLALNRMLVDALDEWLQVAQIIHVTGRGKNESSSSKKRGYVVKELLDDELMVAYAAADLVVCRAGMGTLSDIASLRKAAILIPFPQSGQEANAQAFEDQGAAIVFSQNQPNFGQEVLAAVHLLLIDAQERKTMGERAHRFFPTDDGSELAKRLIKIVERELDVES